MSKQTQTIGILALNFTDNRLESIRYGGELYVREHSMESERAIESARESYDAGFENGMKACLQQLDGLIHKGAEADEIQGWIDRQWEEEL